MYKNGYIEKWKQIKLNLGIMAKVLDCEIVVREFEIQLNNHVHFRANTLGKGMDPFITLAIG